MPKAWRRTAGRYLGLTGVNAAGLCGWRAREIKYLRHTRTAMAMMKRPKDGALACILLITGRAVHTGYEALGEPRAKPSPGARSSEVRKAARSAAQVAGSLA